MGHLVLITGESGTGKSTSLYKIKDHRSVLYLNCEGLKQVPFKNDFRTAQITDPYQIPDLINAANDQPNIEYIVIDTLTYLLDMFVSLYVNNAKDTFKAWRDMQEYFKDLVYVRFANSNKNILVLAHTEVIFDEAKGTISCKVPVPGGLKKKSIESWFNNIVSTKVMSLHQLNSYKNDYLNITEDNLIDEYKYVFQTRKTKDTKHEMMRGPLYMWTRDETFIDNDVVVLMDKLDKMYITEEK